MPVVGIVGFFALKLAAYSAWCWLGLRLLTPARPRAGTAILLGLARVALGLVLGWALVAGMTVAAPRSNRLGVSLPALVLGFVILRWLEWCVLGAVVSRAGWSPGAVLGRSARQQVWRVGGVAVSFATDAGALFGIGALGMIPC